MVQLSLEDPLRKVWNSETHALKNAGRFPVRLMSTRKPFRRLRLMVVEDLEAGESSQQAPMA
jgi:hypothetical protein